MRNVFISITRGIGIFTILLALSFGCVKKSAESKPNVILVMTDDQGYGDLSCHGNPVLKTPNLDQLYEESIRFTDFHVAPMCTPTRGQLLTGLDAMDNAASMVCLGRSMPREELPTMADIFAASGYITAHFGKWHLGDSYPYRPMDRGFQETVYHGAWGITSIADYPGNDYWDDTYYHNGIPEKYEGYCTDVWFDLALDYIGKWKENPEKPFFLYLATNCPHSPHWVDDKYSDHYQQPGIEPAVTKFFGQIANIDENMGRLIAALDEKGMTDNTILIYMTDNGTVRGYDVYNAGMRGHKTELWEGGHRVPLFIRWPEGKMIPPGDIDELTQCQDVLPTLIDLCRLSAPEDLRFDGTSLAPLLRAEKEKPDDRMLVVEYGAEHLPDNAAVLWKKWRLVRNQELFNIESDPHQDTDLADQFPEILQVMQDHYTKWWEETRPNFEKTRFIHIGSEKQNPLILYSSDWKGDYADNPGNLFAGDRMGAWDVIVEREGEYEIRLSRWHPAAKVPLDHAFTAQNKTGGAIPVKGARIRIGDIEQSKPAGEGQSDVTFTVNLKAGKNKIETWFLDKDNNPTCSAYYTSVKRK